SELRLLHLNEFNLEIWRIADFRDEYMGFAQPSNKKPGVHEHWDKGIAATFNLDLFRYRKVGVYFNNFVHTDGTNHQVRSVGWKWDAGVSLNSKLDVFYKHHSRHVMDAERDSKFPLENRYGIRFKFISK